jgi:uncharacterized protein (DUF2342 family)
MTRDEATEWFVQTLMDRVREDRFPSATHMNLIEQSLPQEMVSEYLEILMDKIEDDNVPSLEMLRRIQRVADSLPRYERAT